MAYVDEKIAKISLDNKTFTKNAEDTLKTLDRLKKAFEKAGDVKTASAIEKEMAGISKSVGNSVNKSSSMLSKLSSIFKKSTSNIDMSGAAKSVDKMNTDIANKTARTSDILSRLKGIFQKADNSEGFPNTVASIDKLNSKVASFDASPLSTAFQSAATQVQNSISVMDIALGNFIANGMTKVVGFGKQFLSGPVDGYSEYQNKMNSIQTITSNTAEAFSQFGKAGNDVQMTQINRTLADLNEYADQTIYSFEDMTRNIGTFTAAGVGLEDSAIAIKGIANLAAASGSSSMQASSAMYQLSQALASGKVGLMDWNSVVTAGMGGELFKDALYDTAEAMGVNVDRTKSFRDSLQDGWVTAEVLLKTLKGFSENEMMIDAATKVKSFSQLIDTTKEAIGSGWSDTWELVFGGLQEAKGLWSDVAKEVGKFIDDSQGKYYDEVLKMERNLGNFRNAVLRTWKDTGGQEAFFNSIKNSVSFIMQSLTSLRSGFRSAFGDYQTVAANLVSVTKRVEAFTESLKNFYPLQMLLKNTGALFGETIGLIGNVLGSFFSGISVGGSTISNFVLILNNGVKTIKNFIKSIRENENVMQGFKNLGGVVGNVLKVVFNLFEVGARIVQQFFSSFNLGGDGSGFKSFTELLLSASEQLVKFSESLLDAVKKGGMFKAIGSAISGVLKLIAKALSAFFGSSNIDFNSLGDKISSLFDKIFSTVSNVGSKILSALGTFGGSLGKLFSEIFAGFKEGYGHLKQAFKDFDLADIIKGVISAFALANYGKIRNGGMTIFESIKEYFEKDFLDKIYKNVAGFTDQIGETLGGFGDTLNSFSGMVDATKLLIIAGAVLMLTVSMEKLSRLDMKDLSKGMIGLGTAAAILMKGMMKLSALSAMGSGIAPAMIAFAISLRILASAMVKASEIDSNKLGTAIGGMVSAMLTLTVGMKLLSKVGNVEVGMMKLIGFAASMLILANALDKIAQIDPDRLMPAVASMFALMTSLSLSIKLLNNVKVKMGAIISLTAYVTAIRILISGVKKIADIDPERLIPSVVAIGALMAALSLSVRSLKGIKISDMAVLNLSAFVAAIHGLVISVEKLSKIKWQDLLASTASISALLFSLAGATRILNNVNVKTKVIATLLAFSASIYGLALSIEKITKLPLNDMLVSLAVVEGLMLSLAGLTHIVKGVKPPFSAMATMLGMSGAIYGLAVSIEKITKLPLNDMLISLAVVEGMLVSLVGLSRVVKGVKVDTSSLFTLMTLVIGVETLSLTVERLSAIKPKNLLTATGSIMAMMTGLVVVMRTINSTSSTSTQAVAQAGILISFGEMLKGIADGLTAVADKDWKQIGIATGAIAIVIFGLTRLLKSVPKDVNLEDVGALATLAGVMNQVGDALSKVADKNWASLLAATVAMGGTLVAMTYMVKSLDKISGQGSLNLLALSVAMMAIAVPIKILSTIGWVGIAAGLVATAGNLTLFMIAGAMGRAVAPGLFALSSAMMAFGAASLLSSASLLMTATAFGIITASIANLVKIAPEGMRAVVESFNIFVQSLGKNIDSIVQGLVKVTKSILTGLKTLLPDLVTFGFELITNILKGLTKAAPELVKAAVEFVVEFGRALVDNAVILVQTAIELVQTLADGILDAIPQLVSTFANIATKFIQMLGTELGKHAKDLADAFGVLLKQMVVIISPLIKDFLAPLTDIIVSSFAPIIQKVIDLVVSAAPVIVPIIETIGSVIETVVNGVVRIVEALAPHLSSIIESVRGVVEALAPVIITFLEQVTATIQALAPVAIALIQGIVDIVQVLGDVVMTVINGVVSIFQTLGATIESVAWAIVAAIQSVGDVISAVFSGIEGVITAVGGVIESVGSSIKSVLEGIADVARGVGEGIKSALDGVANIIKEVGDAIVAVSDSISGGVANVLDSIADIFDSMGTAAEQAGKGFRNVAKGVSEILQYSLGELVSNLGAVGDVIVNISRNSEGISAAGSAMSKIGTGLSSISTNGQAATMILTSLATSIPAITTSISALPAALQQSAMGMQMFGMGLQNGIMMAIPMVVAGMQNIVMAVQATGMQLQMTGTMIGQQLGSGVGMGVSTGIPMAQASASMLGLATNTSLMTSLNPAMGMTAGSALGSGVSVGIASQTGAVAGSSSTLASTSVNAIRGGFAPASSLGSTFGSQVSSGISGTIGQNSSVSRNLANSSVNAVRGGFAPASSLGQRFGSQVASGVRSQSGSVSSAGSAIANSGRSGAQSVSWYSAGSFLGQGLANGISSMAGYVMSVAHNLAASASAAIRRALDIHSPSRVTYAFGEFFSEGFINGIASLTGEAGKVSTALADNAVEAIEESSNVIENALNNDLDFNPTITPVVDMSNMKDLEKIKGHNMNVGVDGIGITDTGHYRHQNGGTSTTNNSAEYNYDINVNVEGGDKVDPRKLAREVQAEIKRLHDRTKFGRGEQPVW